MGQLERKIDELQQELYATRNQRNTCFWVSVLLILIITYLVNQ